MAIFEQRLKSLREEMGLSQAEVARQLNISNQTLYHYEHGREPNYEKLIKIAEFYRTTTDYLVGGSNIRNPEKDNEMTDVQNRSIELDFTEITALETHLKEHSISHRDISKLMCFGEIFEEKYEKYINGEVLFDALPVDAIRTFFDCLNSIKSNSDLEEVAKSCMRLSVKMQHLYEKMLIIFLKKQEESINVKKE
jgi:transcriptional regulator with XRE-family HTH domain